MFRRLIDINTNGNFLVTQTVGREMIKPENGGSIIFIASMSGSIVNYPQGQCCYNASKAGVIQLTKSLAAEWSRYGIGVNSISPGYMETALNRMPALDAQRRYGLTTRRKSVLVLSTTSITSQSSLHRTDHPLSREPITSATVDILS